MDELKLIVERAKKGDSNAIETVVNIYQESLLRYCFFLCHDLSVAQDLCQESFVHAIENIKKLNSCESFKPWLFKIAKNQFLDRIKRADNNLKSLDEISLDQIPAQKDCDVVEMHHVVTILSSMGETERLVLILVSLEQFSYKEAGDILGLSEGAIRSRLHHARNEFIEKYGNDFESSVVLLK